MPPVPLFFIFLFLTFIRYTFLPLWPLNFLPAFYLAWQNQKTYFIWYLLLLGLVNDIFSLSSQFGFTALIFVFLGLITYLIDRHGTRSLFTFLFTGLILGVLNGIYWQSLLLFPAAIAFKLQDQLQKH